MRIEINLETLTPLFIAGANQQQAELRTSSARGELRYWFRAGFGGIIGDQNLSQLADVEAAVFGDTGFSSPVTIRFSAPDKSPANYPLLPHRPNDGETNAYPPSTKFSLILLLNPRGSLRQLETATWTALLWLTLGGLGRRSRRGAGSVRIKEVVLVPDSFSPVLKETLQLAVKQADDSQQLARQVEAILKNVRQGFQQFAKDIVPKFSPNLPAFSILRDDTRIVVKPPDNEELPIPWLMETMSDLKHDLRSTRFAEAFGGIGPDNFGGSRRASPLHVTLHQTQSGPALVFTYLAAKILEANPGHPEVGHKFLDDLKGIPVNLSGGNQ